MTGLCLIFNVQTEKQQKKQAKRDRVEKLQQEAVRLGEVLILQNVLDSLGSEVVREELLAGKHSHLVIKMLHIAFIVLFFLKIFMLP